MIFIIIPLINILILEIISFSTTRVSFSHKVFLYFKIRREVEKIIPDWWKIKYVSFITIEKITKKRSNIRSGHSTLYSIYIECDSKINEWWCNDFISVDYRGEIKEEEILKSIKMFDKYTNSDIKSWKRNKSLSDLGI